MDDGTEHIDVRPRRARTTLLPQPFPTPTTAQVSQPAAGAADDRPIVPLEPAARPDRPEASLASEAYGVARRLRPELVVALVAVALSIASYLYYSHNGLTLAYDDALSHMMIARRAVVGRTPGLAQLGQFWLPLTHMMMLPLVWNDWLFRTGLAGSIPSMFAYVVGAVYTYRLSQTLFSSGMAGWLSAAAYLLNPSLLYMQATAMTEAPLLSAAIIATFYAVQWAHTDNLPDLVKAAAAVAAATLIRYDGWAIAAMLAVVVVIIAWRRHGWGGARAYTILFGTLAFSGCAAWILYNQILFGNGLNWYNGPYSAQFQETRISGRGGLPTDGNWLLSFRVYGQTVIDTVGLPVVVLAAAGLLAWCVWSRLRLRTWPVYAPLVLFAFNWLSLERGITVLRTPEFTVNGAATWFNVRYGMEMIPAVALFLGMLVVHRLRYVRIATFTVLLCFLSYFAVSDTFVSLPYVVHDPLQSRSSGVVRNEQQVGEFLAQHYKGGAILLSYSPFAPAVYYSELPDRVFLTDANGPQYHAAIAHPQDHDVSWILMDPESINYDPISVALGQRTDWKQYYVLRATIGTAQIYERLPNATNAP